MTKLTHLFGSAAVALMFTAGSADADNWSRSWTGPNGGTRFVAGSCANGVCSRSVHAAGPNGATRSRSGQCGYHGCGYSAYGTGPNDQSWSRSGGVVHGPYRSYGYGAMTGPAGHTYAAGRIWRRY